MIIFKAIFSMHWIKFQFHSTKSNFFNGKHTLTWNKLGVEFNSKLASSHCLFCITRLYNRFKNSSTYILLILFFVLNIKLPIHLELCSPCIFDDHHKRNKPKLENWSMPCTRVFPQVLKIYSPTLDWVTLSNFKRTSRANMMSFV